MLLLIMSFPPCMNICAENCNGEIYSGLRMVTGHGLMVTGYDHGLMINDQNNHQIRPAILLAGMGQMGHLLIANMPRFAEIG